MDTEMSAIPLGPSSGADTSEAAAADPGPTFDPSLAAPPPAAALPASGPPVAAPPATFQSPASMGLPMPSQITAQQADALSKVSNSDLGALVGKVMSQDAAPTGSAAATETTVELARVTDTLIAQADAAGTGQIGAAQSGAAQIAALSPPVTFLPGPDGKAMAMPGGTPAPSVMGAVKPDDPGSIGSTAVVQSVATTGASMTANAAAEASRQQGKSEAEVAVDWANAFLATYVELVKMLAPIICTGHPLAEPTKANSHPHRRPGAPAEERSAPASSARPAQGLHSRRPESPAVPTGPSVQTAAIVQLETLAAAAADVLATKKGQAAIQTSNQAASQPISQPAMQTPVASEAVASPVAEADPTQADPTQADPTQAGATQTALPEALPTDQTTDPATDPATVGAGTAMDPPAASAAAMTPASNAQQIVQAAAATQARIAHHFHRPTQMDSGPGATLDRDQQLRCHYEVLLAAAVIDLAMQSNTLSMTRPGTTGANLGAGLSAEFQLRREARFGDGFGPNRRHAAPIQPLMAQT